MKSVKKDSIADRDHEDLLKTTRRLLAEVQALSSRIAAVNEIATAMNRLLNLKDILKVVSKQAKWLMDFSHFSVCLRNLHGQIEFVTLFGQDIPFDYPALAPDDPIASAFRTGSAQLVHETNGRFALGSFSSQISIALESEHEVIGTLNFAANKERAYTQEDIRIGYLLALQLASAIRNAHRFEQLRLLNLELDREKKRAEDALIEVELLNENLSRVNEELHVRNMEKDEFFGIVAHDLKNPIASIMLDTSIIMNYHSRLSPEEQLQRIQKIHDTTERMNMIISQLLDINALESGLINFSFEHIDINALANSAIHQFSEMARKKDIHISWSIPDKSHTVFADRNYLYAVVDNLISNAIKYSPHKKSIFIETGSDENSVRLSVRDEGPGLSTDDQKRLFGKFQRLSAKPTGGEGSTGLGLSIVKKLTEGMGGRVWCESRAGCGATFFLEFPHFRRS